MPPFLLLDEAEVQFSSKQKGAAQYRNLRKPMPAPSSCPLEMQIAALLLYPEDTSEVSG